MPLLPPPPPPGESRRINAPKALSFFGGGKDSLVAAKLLETLGQPYDSLVYASSIYGQLGRQHEQITGLLNHCSPERRHRQWIFDDFMDSPVLALGPDTRVKTLTAAETPSSIFASLPVVMANDISEICLAHEKSADTGQVFWNRTGEDVNHQWGKSFEAEKLINRYIRDNLLPDFHYYSILKSIHDVMIFNLLREHEEFVPQTHSCNVQKPWCKRCPKCLYVWVNYMAYLQPARVEAMFGENLADVPENVPIFRAMLGFTEGLPFECIGQSHETQLAFELCIAKGLTGSAFDMYIREKTRFQLDQALEKYLTVYSEESEVPARFKTTLDAKLQSTAEDARRYIKEILNVRSS